MKRGSTKSAFFLLAISALVILGTVILVNMLSEYNTITANTIAVSNDKVIRVPDSVRKLPNEKEGTIVLWTKPPVKIFDQFEDARSYLVFFSAENVPGLRVAYNLRTQRFEAGTPLMTSSKINIFDKMPHKVAYTYKENHIQALYIDGIKVNSSKFLPPQITQITGLSTLEIGEEVNVEGFEIQIS